jgi:hypothetical protein
MGVVQGALDTVYGTLGQIQGAVDAARRLVGSMPGVPSVPSGSSEGAGGEPAAPTSSAQALLPVARSAAAFADTAPRVIQIQLPGGVYYTSLTDLAYAVDREQARVVTAGQR